MLPDTLPKEDGRTPKKQRTGPQVKPDRNSPNLLIYLAFFSGKRFKELKVLKGLS